MKLDGSLTRNLATALRSARKFKGHPVHVDTLQHWKELVARGRAQLRTAPTDQIQALVRDLEVELAARSE